MPEVQTLTGAAPGDFRVTGKLGGKHPADGMTAMVEVGDGATMTIINPQSFDNGGPEWVMRYGSPEGIGDYPGLDLWGKSPYLSNPTGQQGAAP